MNRIAAIAIAAAIASLSLAWPASAAPLPDGFFTVNAASLKTDSARDKHAAAISKLGIRAVRADVLWNTTEPNAPANGVRAFNFSGYDPFVASLARNGLTWRPLVFGSPSWNRPEGSNFHANPTDPTLLAGWTQAFLGRYGVNGTFWRANPSLVPRPVRWLEVWNEPNFSPSLTGVLKYGPEGYAALLRAAEIGAHAADPGAQVVVGGLVPHTTTTNRGMAVSEYLGRIAAADPALPPLLAGIAVHIYGTQAAPVMQSLGAVRAQVQATPFAGRTLHLNETGMSVVTGDKTRETLRSDMLNKLATQTAAASLGPCNVGSIAPYTWRTGELDRTNPEDWFGIANANATLKPSATALGKGIAAARAGTLAC